MDMIKCKACGKDIAKNADTCPHCGYKVPMSNSAASITLVLIMGLAIVIGLLVVSYGNRVFF